MKFLLIAIPMALLSPAIFADTAADRAQLNGTWEGPQGSNAAVWTLVERGDSMHVTYSLADHKVAEFDCKLGPECKAKIDGHNATVSVYFNGAQLIEIETRGSEVLKRRFGVAAQGQGNQLDIEVIPIVPDGPSETLHFKRAAVATSSR